MVGAHSPAQVFLDLAPAGSSDDQHAIMCVRSSGCILDTGCHLSKKLNSAIISPKACNSAVAEAS